MPAATKRRARRIAADEAHAWARNLRLDNPLAKLVLCMLALYVNGNGVCFVSVNQLSEDCEVASNTIRSRLRWLESIGAVAMRPQWIDESGRRNGDGRGKRTTDEIAMLLTANTDDIEARARGASALSCEGAGQQDIDVSPSPGEGLNPGQDQCRDSISPAGSPSVALQLREGAESSEHEHEPESLPPNPPPQHRRYDDDDDFERDIAEAKRTYPGGFIADLPKFRAVMATLATAERKRVLQAIIGYRAMLEQLDRQSRRRSIKDAHRFVSSNMWEGFVDVANTLSGPTTPLPVSSFPIHSPEAMAIKTAYAIAGKEYFCENVMIAAGSVHWRGAISPQLLALKEAPLRNEWVALTAEQAEAWNRVIASVVRVIWNRLREGARAPWPWPPRGPEKLPRDGGRGFGN
jgi:hypothetical protein